MSSSCQGLYPQGTLLRLLYQFKGIECSEARDTVCALLGLVIWEATGKSPLQAYYTISCHELCQKLLQYGIPPAVIPLALMNEAQGDDLTHLGLPP
jgi:hypothetical protein